MKKFLALLLAVFGVFTIASCKDEEPETPNNEENSEQKTEYTVTFDSKGGSSVAELKSDKTTGKVAAPKNPTKDFYEFEGWYAKENLTGDKFDFTKEITGNITLYAKWTLIEESMAYADFMALETGDAAIIEGYIADKQSWWSDKATMYLTTDTAGEGYFIYEFAMTKDEYNNKYKIGTKIQVYGLVAEYAGEKELAGDKIDYNLTNVISDGKVPNTIVDVTYSVKDEDLLAIQNSRFTATLKVAEYTSTDQNTKVAESKAYGYKGDEPNNDLYLLLQDANGNKLNCCVEVYLTSVYEDVSAVVKTLTVGQTVEIEGYMYWYNGANPHITSIKVDDEDVMYETFMSTPNGEEVSVEGILVAKTTWYNGKTNLYLSSVTNNTNFDYTSGEGYYIYEYECTKEYYDNNLFADVDNGVYVKVTGTKYNFAGMHEVVNATITSVSEQPDYESYNFLIINSTDEGITLDQVNENQVGALFEASGLKVVEFTTSDKNTTVAESKAYGYKGDEATDDLYFTLEDENGNQLNCCIETYVNYDASTRGEGYKAELYEKVKSLEIGDVVEVLGFMYWWNGPNPHIFELTIRIK